MLTRTVLFSQIADINKLVRLSLLNALSGAHLPVHVIIWQLAFTFIFYFDRLKRHVFRGKLIFCNIFSPTQIAMVK